MIFSNESKENQGAHSLRKGLLLAAELGLIMAVGLYLIRRFTTKSPRQYTDVVCDSHEAPGSTPNGAIGEAPSAKEITFEATPANVQKAIDFVSEKLRPLQCEPKTQIQLVTAVDEIVSNVAQYAYAPGVGDVTVRFEAKEGGAVAEITFIDRGVAFNPLEASEPDIALGAKMRKIGGLGIFLTMRTMNEVEYERKGDLNIMRVRKKLGD